MKKYVITNFIWRVVAIYFMVIIVSDYLHIRYNPMFGQIMITPFISVAVGIDAVVIFLVLFRTKISYLVMILFLLLSSLAGIATSMSKFSLIYLANSNNIDPFNFQVDFGISIALIIFQIVLLVCLVGTKSSRQEFKQAHWFNPTIL